MTFWCGRLTTKRSPNHNRYAGRNERQTTGASQPREQLSFQHIRMQSLCTLTGNEAPLVSFLTNPHVHKIQNIPSEGCKRSSTCGKGAQTGLKQPELPGQRKESSAQHLHHQVPWKGRQQQGLGSSGFAVPNQSLPLFHTSHTQFWDWDCRNWSSQV